ncbi:MAG: hypothetical protein Kow0063_21070 [Anaerolineae bacterium]
MPLRGTMKHENRGADFLVCPGTGWPAGPRWGKACPTLAIFRVVEKEDAIYANYSPIPNGRGTSLTQHTLGGEAGEL